MRYTHLMLSGGGMYGLIYIGIYRYLKTHQFMSHIKYIYGTSIGSIAGFFMGFDLECEEMESIVLTPDKYFQAAEVRSFDLTNCLLIQEKNGIFTTHNIRTIFIEFLKQRYDIEDITFIEYLKKTGKDFHINAMCVNSGESVDFNAKTHPNMSVLTAIEASICIPIIFRPIEYDNLLYVDGATVNNLPLHWTPKDPTQKVLAINILYSYDTTTPQLKSNILTYLMCLFMSVLKGTLRLEIDTASSNIDLLTIPTANLKIPLMAGDIKDNLFQLNYPPELVEKIILQGYIIMHEYLGKALTS